MKTTSIDLLQRCGFLLACVCVALLGCGGEDDENVAELLRRQKMRESNELTQDKTPQEVLQQAQKDYDLKNYQTALAAVQPLLIKMPDNVRAVLLTAKCQAELGQKLQAAKLIESIEADNQDIRPRDRYLAVDWFVDVADYESAQAILSSVLHQDPNQKSAHRKMAELFHAQGRRFDAATHLRTLARLNDATEKELFAMNSFREPFIDTASKKPNFDELVPAVLAQAKMWHGDGDISKSRPTAMALAKAFPDSTPVSAFLLRVFAEEQDEAMLLESLEKLPNGIDREPEYWYSLGLLHRSQNKHDVAVRCFGEAVSRDDTDRVSYLAMSRSLKLLGDDDAADRAAKRHDLLLEAYRLAAKFGVADGSPADLTRMADIMDKVHRPWEAVAWRKVLLRKEGVSIELQQLKARREQLAADEVSNWPSAIQATCGIDLQKYPLPALNQIESAPISTSQSKQLIADRPIIFHDVAATVGLQFQYDNGDRSDGKEVLLHQLTGSGIGVIDFDLDGWMDLYLTQSGPGIKNIQSNDPNQLYRNLDGQRFTLISECGAEDRSYGQGVAAADINQDGFIDLIVANIGHNVLLINQGDGTFRSERLAPQEQNDGSWTTTIAVGDLNGDHLPDIVEVNYIDDAKAFETPCDDVRSACSPNKFRPATDRIWQTTDKGKFVPLESVESIDESANYGFAALIANFDNENGNDLFVANDTENNQYWVSNKSGNGSAITLIESSQMKGCGMGLLGQRQGCMGLASGDFDRNGTLDMHITNYWNQPADLYLQQDSGIFLNGVAKLGLRQASRETVGWGTQAADFDRNGWLDLAVLNGHLVDQGRGIPYKMSPQLFRGSHKGFELIESTDGSFWSKPALGRTMALVDFNRDGKPDVVASHLDTPVVLLENKTNGGNHLQLELVGTTTERDAVGAKILIRAEDQVWTNWVTGGDGLLCTNEPTVDFGIGPIQKVDEVTIDWPSGKTQTFRDVTANAKYVATESESELWPR